MSNPRLTGNDSEPWFTFDILVSSNISTKYLDNCLMKIGYDDRTMNSAFGSNIVSNNNVEVLLLGAFNTSTYANPSTLIADNSGTNHTLNIPMTINTATVPLNRVLLTSSPQSLLTVRIKIKNIGKTMGIVFEDLTVASGLSYFTASPSTPWTGNFFSYSSTNYIGSNSDESAIPIITNFNNNIRAGKNEELTITGRYFGKGMGTDGSVIFINADNNQYPVEEINAGIDHYDVISWNHNEIKIIVPSIIDSISKNVNSSGFKAVPGTGFFKVRNRYGYVKQSSTELNIPQAILQSVDLNPINDNIHKYSPELKSIEGSGYIVRIGQDVISTYPQAKKVIEKALREWTCVTGIDWKLGPDISTPTDYQDGICQISLYNDASDPVLMGTFGQKKPCGTVFPRQFYQNSFDIRINSAYLYDLDTLGDVDNNKYDFYKAFLHELGHAHILNHANREYQDLMFWSSDKGVIPFVDRLTLKQSPDAQDAGNYVTSNLVGPLSGCTDEHILSYPKFCNRTSSVFDREINEPIIGVYPNPISSSNEINVDLGGILSIGKTTFFVYDSYGREVQIISSSSIGNNLYKIQLEELSSGMYHINVLNDKNKSSVVFMKL
jgi:hypothetical protein